MSAVSRTEAPPSPVIWNNAPKADLHGLRNACALNNTTVIFASEGQLAQRLEKITSQGAAQVGWGKGGWRESIPGTDWAAR